MLVGWRDSSPNKDVGLKEGRKVGARPDAEREMNSRDGPTADENDTVVALVTVRHSPWEIRPASEPFERMIRNVSILSFGPLTFFSVHFSLSKETRLQYFEW